MNTEIVATVSGPGWTAVVEHPGHTAYVIVYRQDTGKTLRVPFDPREDGTDVVANLKEWTEPTGTELPDVEKPKIIEALTQALNAFFVRDDWRLWTATWPRFPLAWKGAQHFLIEHWPDKWLQYSEIGRSILLDCEAQRFVGANTPPHVRVHKPKKPVWSYPPEAGEIESEEWQRIQTRLEQWPNIVLEWM